MRRFVFALALALAACGPKATTTPTTTATTAQNENARSFDLTCAAFADVTSDSLVEMYGADNVAEQTLDGAEGEQYQATVVFPNDPARRIEVQWAGEAEDAHPSTVSARADHNSAWIGPHGLAIGQTIAEVQQKNGRPFTVYGFDWDYGGMISDWKGGALAEQGGCSVHGQFDQTAQNYSGAEGDREFASDSAAMRGAAPVLRMILIRLPEPRDTSGKSDD